MKRIFPISLTLTGLLTASVVTFIALALICVKQAVAHTYHSHKPVKPVTMTAEQMSELVNQSTRPNFNEQDLAPVMATLETLAEADRITHQERLVYARLLQHQHKFSDALAELDTLLAERPDHPSALLLQANVQLNQGQPALARQTCLQLMGKTAELVMATCLLEANMQLSPSTQYYSQLHNISKKFPAASAEIALWVNEVLADLALFANKPATAIDHIEQQPDSVWPISSWVAWSKAKLALQQGNDILARLAPKIANNPAPNDSALLYLALAEQQTGEGQKWTAAMAQRVFVREQRGDTTHAAEVALYYLHLAAEPQQALHWANINWQQAKSFNDEQLLSKIRMLAAADG
tara:strand:- start:1388 stop:2440 length:1053 start_codon:yes stop_codon:yes gene_type:complete